MTEVIHKEEAYKIMGACFEVYKQMGTGFMEPVYQECLSHELTLRNIPFQEQQGLSLCYKNQPLKHTYKPDFICYDCIILEIKAVSELSGQHRAQIHNYLKAADFRLGLLVNFSYFPGVQYERIVR